ncbi:MAG: ABC transporter ATP-binding protein [Deltaproteobacteria bacterium]|nr:MAG: ABC transporter ATP-binding protein [Deltaproteobacteria bacterium]
MSESLLVATKVTKRFGGFVALEGVDLSVATGERVGLIGPNGSGKSTFASCIAGTVRGGGTIRFDGRDLGSMPPHRRIRLGIARTFQIPRPFASMTVLDNLRVPLLYAAQKHPLLQRSLGHERDEAMAILKQVGLEAKADRVSRELTQVDMRKLELARAIASHPKLLVADEALAGLSPSEVDEVLAILLEMKSRGVAVILIEHIMRAVLRFSERIAVLVAGRKIADGPPGTVVRDPEVERAYLGG